MASQELKHRTTPDEPTSTTNAEDNIVIDDKNKKPRKKRSAMAKHGLKSLTIALSLPFTLTLVDLYLFGSSKTYGLEKPRWFPPLRALHLTCLVSSLLMALSAWLVWAEGGFHRKPAALGLYLIHLALALAWDPIVLWMGAEWVGLVVCLATIGALVACAWIFREINPIAGALVLPCLAWTAFLSLVTFTLI